MKSNNEPKEPYELFGIECGEGWKGLYQPIIDYIEDYNKDKEDEDKIEIYQIKEKFGTLSFYVSKKTDELRKMIEDAEAESYHVCEMCGRHINKQIVEHHWVYGMCRECYDGMKTKQEKIMEEFENKIKAKRKKRENSKD
jgi:ribosomal protein L37AE/L43A